MRRIELPRVSVPVPRGAPLLLLAILVAALWACFSGDPVTSVLRVFAPMDTVWMAFSAPNPGVASDRVVVEWGIVGNPARGFVYEAWLVSDDGTSRLSLARFREPLDSTKVPADSGIDLVAAYSQFEVTLEPRTGDDSGPTEEMATHRAVAEADARTVLRALLSDASGTPPGTGYAVGFLLQASALQTQAQLAAAAAAGGDQAGARRHLEHALNIIDGTAIDHDGDGQVENSDSDGFGLWNYANQTQLTAAQADAVANPWEDFLQNGVDLVLLADSTASRIDATRLVALDGVATGDPAILRERADTLRTRAGLILGIETAPVDAECRSCGALTAWRKALGMTRIPLLALESFVIEEN